MGCHFFVCLFFWVFPGVMNSLSGNLWPGGEQGTQVAVAASGGARSVPMGGGPGAVGSAHGDLVLPQAVHCGGASWPSPGTTRTVWSSVLSLCLGSSEVLLRFNLISLCVFWGGELISSITVDLFLAASVFPAWCQQL